jgi:hypothetical protein
MLGWSSSIRVPSGPISTVDAASIPTRATLALRSLTASENPTAISEILVLATEIRHGRIATAAASLCGGSTVVAGGVSGAGTPGGPAAGTRTIVPQSIPPRASVAAATRPFATMSFANAASRWSKSIRPCPIESVSTANSGVLAPAAVTDSFVTSRSTSCTVPETVPSDPTVRSKLAFNPIFPVGASSATSRDSPRTTVATARPFSSSVPFAATGFSPSSPAMANDSPAAVRVDSR